MGVAFSHLRHFDGVNLKGEVLDSKYRKFGGWRIQVKRANNRIRKESSDRSPPRPQSVRGGAAVDGLVMQSDKVVVV